ncbi:hypothetical protein [Novosphingopyxis baekryungensis]|uniref:hypothetical protein n=1 Tax=Novosphingopyxis baekryungensis TaxID=279369 RepID=UPI0012EBA784|nr:hypothetical protein [Novosphingopyxis baekryungensis]
MITVSVDHARKTVIARMSGFLSTEDVEAFARKEQEAVESMDLGSGQFYLLIDTAEAIIQPQDVVAAFQHLVQNAVYKAARIAVARHGSLTKMQTERILRVRGDAAMFETLAEAEEWLFSEPLGADKDGPRSRDD